MILAEEILKPSIDYGSWLLLDTLIQISIGRHKLSKEKYKMHSLGRKEALVSIMELKEIKHLKKSLILNEIKGAVISGYNSIQISFHLLKRN